MGIFKEAKIAKITKIAMIAKVAKIAKAEMMAKAAMMAKVAMTTAVIFILCILGGCGKETEGPASGAGVAAGTATGTATDTPSALSVDTSTASAAGDAEMSDLINTKEVAVGAGAGGDRKMSESGDGSGSNTEEAVSSDARSGNSVSSDAVSSDALNSDAGDNTMRTDEEAKGDFYVSEISDEIFAKMQGKSFKADCKTARSDLRYVHVLHKDISGVTHEGELVVNKKIAKDVLEIFEELYNNSYPIEKVRLIDEYNADDELSMRDNNSSAFNYRTIAGTNRISKHGSGMAVDINTLYNPYVKIRDDGSAFIQPETAGAYTNRNADFPYKIESGDLCCRLFKEHGFEWGGDWTSRKDYQHFEK